MFKAILYYLLMIFEFIITMFGAGLVLGIYISHAGIENKAMQLEKSVPLLLCFWLLGMLVIWFTFYKAKFAKFSFGLVAPNKKWKAMLYTTLPIFGFTLFYYSLTQLLGISINISELKYFSYVYTIPFMVVGSFISAYIFYGAILEELIKCGKSKWVSFLTLFLMVFFLSFFAVLNERFGGIVFLIDVFVTTVYAFFIYYLTRSSIILFVIYVTANLIPFNLGPTPLCVALGIVGLAMAIYGAMLLNKGKSEILIKEDEGEPFGQYLN